jgi:hypothetical protein
MIFFLLGLILLFSAVMAKIFWFFPLDFLSTLHVPSWFPLSLGVLFVAWCLGEGKS